MSPEVLAAARTYTAQGWAIVAVRANKKPWGDTKDGKNWRRRFTPQEIEQRLKGPHCVAIGFLGGELNHNIVPLDFDTEAGETWWREKCEAAGIDPDDFPCVITPGKLKPDGARRPGRHRYVTDTRGTLGNSQGKLKELGVDVRGNGHAMLPPSPHPDGGLYRWAPGHRLDDFPDGIPACPGFAYEAIEDRRKASSDEQAAPQGGNGQVRGDAATYKYCRAALNNERQRVAQAAEGARNQTLNDAALSLGRLAHLDAFGQDEVRAALYAACEANGYIADDGRHAFEATFSSGWKDGVAGPREIPDRRPPQQGASSGARPRTPPPAGGLTQRWGWAAAQPQPLGTVVRGLLHIGSLTLFYGAPKSGKSFLLTDLFLAIASAQKSWMGYTIVRSGPVLYVACEGHAGFWKRLRAKAIEEGWNEAAFPSQFGLATGRPMLITSDEPRVFVPHPDDVLAALAEARAAGHEPLAVAIDTVFRSFGGGNVNASDHMNAYLQALAAISDTGVAVAVVHHQTKSNGTPAGSVTLTGGVDTIAHVAKTDEGGHSFEVEAAKDDAATAIRGFDLAVVDLDVQADGQPASSCVVISDVPPPAPKAAKTAKLPAAASICLRALKTARERAGFPNELPPDVPTTAVTQEKWRQEVYQLKGEDAELNRKTFNRGQSDLLARELISQRFGWVWRTEPAQ